LDVDAGDMTLTVTSGYNADADTDIVFDDAGDFVLFYSVEIGATYRWRVATHEGTDVAMETGDFDTISLGGTAITSTADELNQLDGNILNDLALTAGVGITGTADDFASKVVKIGTLFKTTIVIDVDGLHSGGTANDIIGADGAGVAHLGQITAARNGTIFAVKLTCIETPTTGDDDIDLWSADEPSGVEDTLITDLSNQVQLTNGGALTAGTIVGTNGVPVADQHLYLASAGGAASAEYATGILLIELWGA